MRHKWLLEARRQGEVMECEKGRGDKGWRIINGMRGLFTKKKKKNCLWKCWVTGRVKLQTSSLSPSVSSLPTSSTPRHTACPHPTAKQSHTHAQNSRGRRMRHIVTAELAPRYQRCCRHPDLLQQTRSQYMWKKEQKNKHPLIKNYSNRLGAWWLDDVCLMWRRKQALHCCKFQYSLIKMHAED